MYEVIGKTEDGQLIVVIPEVLISSLGMIIDIVRNQLPKAEAVTVTEAIETTTKDTKTTVPRGVYGRGRPKPKKVKPQSAQTGTDHKPKYVIIREIIENAARPVTVLQIVDELNRRGIAAHKGNVCVSLATTHKGLIKVGKAPGGMTLWWAAGRPVPGEKKPNNFNPHPQHGTKHTTSAAPVAGGSRLALIKERAERLNNSDPVERAHDLASRQQAEDAG